MKALSALCAAAAAAWLAAPAHSQVQVVISEINFSPQNPGDDEWIELRNVGNTTADLSAWSLYLATNTPGLPRTYWFAFPPNTFLSSQSSMRVHWLAPVQPSTFTEIYTGNTVYHFLFGYGAESLGANRDAGALALLTTQNNLLMNSPAIVHDWITWGDDWTAQSRPSREDLAVQAGRWNTNAAVASPEDLDSIALIYTANTEPTSVSAYFHDASPTPLLSGNPLSGHNHLNAAFRTLEDPAHPGNPGTPCTGGFGQAPTLAVPSIPAAGNRDFVLRLGNLVPGQIVAVLVGLGETELRFPLTGCYITVNPFAAPQLAVPGTSLDVPLPLTNIASSITFYAQAVVYADFTNIGFDPGHEIVVGN